MVSEINVRERDPAWGTTEIDHRFTKALPLPNECVGIEKEPHAS
jgi:hypothetical protein